MNERFKEYNSPYAFKYGSKEMRRIWSEENRWLLARKIWVAEASVQHAAGLVTDEQLMDLVKHQEEIEVDVILSRETNENDPRYCGHDVVAAISEFADKAPVGGAIIHQGNTSEDVLSNVEVMQIQQSFGLIERKLHQTLSSFAVQIDRYKDVACMGYTHNQAAEPTTVGYRLARYAQDLLTDLKFVKFLRSEIKGKGIKGATGTSASFVQLLEGTGLSARDHESMVMAQIGIEPVIVAGQTTPRKYTLLTEYGLSSIAQSCHQFAADVKLLQTSPIAEWAEPRNPKDKGSSAMLHKRNPRHSENIKSLSRGLIGSVTEAWIGASEVTLERGIEDSAGKRSYLPESFLAIDEILTRTNRIIKGLQVRDEAIKRNLNNFAPFMALELVLTELSKKGAHRQEMDQLIRSHVAVSLEEMDAGRSNPLVKLVTKDMDIKKYLKTSETARLFKVVAAHVGDAPQRCEELLGSIRQELSL